MVPFWEFLKIFLKNPVTLLRLIVFVYVAPGRSYRHSEEEQRPLALEHSLQALVHRGDGAEFGEPLPVAMDFGISLGFGAHLRRGPAAQVQEAAGLCRVQM